MEHIFKLQEFCNSMVKLCIDGHEYAYLKAIVLFSPGTEAHPYSSFLIYLVRQGLGQVAQTRPALLAVLLPQITNTDYRYTPPFPGLVCLINVFDGVETWVLSSTAGRSAEWCNRQGQELSTC